MIYYNSNKYGGVFEMNDLFDVLNELGEFTGMLLVEMNVIKMDIGIELFMHL